MMNLLSTFSIEQILVFIVLLALAIKGCVNFYDWAYQRVKQKFAKDEAPDKIQVRFDELEVDLKEIAERQNENIRSINQLREDINILTESDMDDIKAFIVKEHHYFCYDRKWIDDYSLDSIEKRYTHYKQEGGNSFVGNLMNELRALPKQPPEEI